MRLLQEYIQLLLGSSDVNSQMLGQELEQTRASFNVLVGSDPVLAFDVFVKRYNWLGMPENKRQFRIDGNMSRNLVGALMQDYLIHIVTKLLEPYPKLPIFTEVHVPYGSYPVWEGGKVVYRTPSQVADLVVGYLYDSRKNVYEYIEQAQPWPHEVIRTLPKGHSVMPLLVISSKIRVSQGEFFDWQGREQLITKGNPTCLSLQVALRAEMDLSIIEVAQASKGFFLLGKGGESKVIPNPLELKRLMETISFHLDERMNEKEAVVSILQDEVTKEDEVLDV